MPTKPTIRCSDLPRLLACPGSRTLSARIKRDADKGNPAAWEGNWGHHEVARRLVADEDALAPEGGLPPAQCPADYAPSTFARWKAAWCYDQIVSCVEATWTIAVEQPMEHDFGDFILTGHPDVFAFKVDEDGSEFDPEVTELIGFDEKYGALPVDEADSNDQMFGYAVLMVKLYPYLRRLTWKILQPSASEDDGQLKVTECFIEGREKLQQAADYLEKQIIAKLAQPNECDSGPQCRYCPAAEQCPCLDADLKDFMKKTLTPEEIDGIQPETPLERLLELYDARKRFTPVLTSAYEAFKDRLAQFECKTFNLPDGRVAKLNPRNGKRVIEDKVKADEILSTLPDALYYECLEFSAGEIERSLAAHHQVPIGGKKAVTGEKLFEEQFAGVYQQTVNEVLVVS